MTREIASLDHVRMVDAVRVRTIDDVVIAFFEPDVDLDPSYEHWITAMEQPGIRKALALTVGPVRSESARRRRASEIMRRENIRMVVVTDDRHTRGLVRVFDFLGVRTASFRWDELEAAARGVAARPELAEPIVRAALALRAESPSAKTA